MELLSDKVEDLCGVKPEPDAVAAFLRKQPSSVNEAISAPVRKKPRRLAQPDPTTDAAKSTGYELYGQRRRARNARDVLIQVFREFAEREPDFLERFAALPKHGRKRRYLARTREELYPGSPHLVDNAYEVRPGWWVDLHASRAGIETRIRIACGVAGVKIRQGLANQPRIADFWVMSPVSYQAARPRVVGERAMRTGEVYGEGIDCSAGALRLRDQALSGEQPPNSRVLRARRALALVLRGQGAGSAQFSGENFIRLV